MLTLEEAKIVVISRGWLSRTPDDFRDAVLSRVLLQSFRSGESIYSVNDPPGGMYGLVSGSVKVSSAEGEDGPYIAHVMTPGSWSGYGPAIAGCNRIIGLTAGRNCQVLFLPLHAITEIMTGDPAGWRHLAGLALSDARLALGAMDDLMIRDEFRRFLAVLLRAGGCRYGDENGGEPVWMDLSQTDLAHMCNLSRTTTGEFLRKLGAERLVEIRYGRIGILAPAALRGRLAKDA